MVETLKINKNYHIAYSKYCANDKRKDTSVIFLSGFKSDMTGTKASFLENACKKLDISFIRFDYRGHGESSGEFTDFCISDWLEDIDNVITHLVKTEKIIFVGSSMGGWLMLHAALKYKNKVAGLIGIASAVDFTENLVWNNLDDETKHKILTNNICKIPADLSKKDFEKMDEEPEEYFEITLNLIEDGRKHLLFKQNVINIECPVTLIHGMEDEDVPYEVSVKLSGRVSTKDVNLVLVKNGDHRLSKEHELDLLIHLTENIINKIKIKNV